MLKQFLVVDQSKPLIPKEKPVTLEVIGRNGDTPIKLGDVFTHVTTYYERSLDECHRPASITKQHKVSLKVIKIEAYQREFQELSQGMTARITIVGEGRFSNDCALEIYE